MAFNINKNRYLKNARISERHFRQILKEFSFDSTATETAFRTGINRKTINRIFHLFRKRIVLLCEIDGKMSGEVEVDESYFRARRVRGKRGRGASKKIPVVGLLKRGGKVYTKVIKRCTKEELMPVIKGKVLSETTVYTDGWKSYDGLILNGYKHKRVYHSKDEFVRGKSHVNGIESFWSFTKRRMTKFNGVKKDHFLLHLKESEYRWNHRKNKNIYQSLLTNFRKKSL